MQSDRFERSLYKTSEGEFLYELLNSYSLCPKMSESILETAKGCLIRGDILKEGQIDISAASIDERAGKSVKEIRKVRIRLTLDDGQQDREVLKEFGRAELRRLRIQRITQEAIEQGSVLSHEDLSRHLGCDERTIRRDIREIKGRGIDVITRGVLHSIGRGQTHKVKIVGLYLEGKLFSEIKLKTRHSIGAIKRYIQSFTKVLMSYHHGLRSIREISSVTGLSETLVGQYLELVTSSYKDKHRRATMESLISQCKRAGTSIKKSLISGEFGHKAVHMTAGVI